MKERFLSKTPFLTFVSLSMCNTILPGIFGNSKKMFFMNWRRIHTYLNFIWNVKLVKEYWTNVNMLKKHKRKVLDILREILNHEENCSGKTDEIALSCVCVWLWHRQYYNSESFQIQFQRMNAFNTFSLHSQFHPQHRTKRWKSIKEKIKGWDV